MNDKKKLLLVGNAPIPVDVADKVNEFDYILRINRMNNLHNTGNRIDGVFIAAYDDWRNVYHGGENREHYKRAKDIWMTPEIREQFTDWKEYLTEEQWSKPMIISFAENADVSHANCTILTTTVRVLDVLVNAKGITDEYEIWIAGVTLEGRGKMFETGEAWINTEHRWMGHAEERYLKRLVAEGRVKRLIPEIDDSIHNC
jgi:hypothetical protein